MPPKTVYEYPQAGERHLVVGALSRLGATTQHEDANASASTFDQLYRHVRNLATPILDDHEDLQQAIKDELAQPPPKGRDVEPEAWARTCKWRSVGHVMEAWYRAGTLRADPKGEHLTGRDLIDPDPGEASHWFAEQAYRKLLVDAVAMLEDASAVTDATLSLELYDAGYTYLRALTHPILHRLPETLEEVKDLEAKAARNGDRWYRFEAVGQLVRAMHKANVIGPLHVPVDTSDDNPFMQMPDPPETAEVHS